LAAPFNRPRARRRWRLAKQDPVNLKPGDFDKPPGKPRQYYWMNDYEMNAPILGATTTLRLSGKPLCRLNICSLRRAASLRRTGATISRNEK
jgi:hypothetical protein